MKDSEASSFQPQVSQRRRVVEFDLEPAVAELLEQKACGDRIGAILAITAVAMRLFPHWTVLDDPGRGLYAVAANPKVLARRKRGG